MLKTECIKNGFDGAILYLNNKMINYTNFKMYNFTPTHHNTDPTDYYEYTNTIIKPQINNKNINTLFFDFNNAARFSIPYKPQYMYSFTNTTIYNQDYLINTILSAHTEPETEKIILINSWNEWGENMSIEPGEINKTKYLSLIKSNLLSFIR
jgi:hypothetical protein